MQRQRKKLQQARRKKKLPVEMAKSNNINWITPMEPITAKTMINGPEWTHQIKWDGIRGLTYFDSSLPHGKSLRIFTKKGRERTGFYPELNQLENMIQGRNAVLDGELVVLGDDSKPGFQLSLARDRVKSLGKLSYYTRSYPVIYVVFDILYLNDHNLTQLPLSRRRELLYNIVPAEFIQIDSKQTDTKRIDDTKQTDTEQIDYNQIGSNIIITDDFNDGPGLFELMKKKNWEGIVSKKLDSPYLPAKNHKAWYKYKTMKKILAAICGIQLKDNFPNSLVLGINQEGKWAYIGKASLGLTQEDLKNLKHYSEIKNFGECPFPDTIQQYGRELSGLITWLEPEITCWISFLEWTNDGVLRHPKILGFTNHKAEETDGREWALDE